VTPRVFLSYSHDTEAHKVWVRELAERLVASGVAVTLDQWDLRAGMDVLQFGETAIRQADRVLMVCSATYVRKAEQRISGTGQECLIVSALLARNAYTHKFIPLLRRPQPEEHPDPKLIPDFLGTRLWIDFRDDAGFEGSLTELLHELFEVPQHQKPELGVNPFLGRGHGPEPGPAPAPQAGPEPVAAAAELELQPLTVATAQLRREGQGWLVERQRVQVEALEQELGEGVSLRLIRVPAGEFLMGSPVDERQRFESEGPQHRVRVQEFLMGQTPITQAQWGVVAGWQERKRRGRELIPTPHRRGDQVDSDERPVANLSWHQAMEFCNRLSQYTDRHFTLPSEAQWEYACRAATTTPFHFGVTLTAEQANYVATHTYADGPVGVYRGQTMPVGMFPANAWGLHDMHGNVWEWCLDHWHASYEGAPADGSAWVDVAATDIAGSAETRVLRGGSWGDNPGVCRSACRIGFPPGDAFNSSGFRVVCLPKAPPLNP
jgi:formylglycine-generating enzyme required for sulfatase activity